MQLHFNNNNSSSPRRVVLIWAIEMHFDTCQQSDIVCDHYYCLSIYGRCEEFLNNFCVL